MALVEGNHAIETFGLDRAYKPFGVRIRVWGLERGTDHLDPGLVQERSNGLAPLGVPVTDQHAMIDQHLLVRSRERAGDFSVRTAFAAVGSLEDELFVSRTLGDKWVR
jgi:hypothetical protein